MDGAVFLTCFIVAGIYSTTVFCELLTTAIPEYPVYPLDGSSFTALCVGTGDSSPPDNLVFYTRDNKVISEEDDDDGRMTITNKTEGNTVTLTMVLSPIKLRDNSFLEGMSCGASSDIPSHAFNIVVLPENTSPMITIQPTEESGNKDGEISFQCSATTQLVDPVTGVLIKWKFKNLDNQKLLDNNKYEINKSVDIPTNQSSTLKIKDLKFEDQGTYYCYGELQLMNYRTTGVKSTDETFYKTANITSITWETSNMEKKEIESNAGKDVRMTCLLSGYPIPTIIWNKEDEVIDDSTDFRYSFTNSSIGDGHTNNVFILKDVTYTDRALYKCVATHGAVATATQEFRLRVRDPLGPLWPTIGILAEAVLLFIIVGLFEVCHKKKSKKNTNNVDHAPTKNCEKSPLVQGEMVISYTSDGDDGVRARITTVPDET